MYRIGMPYSSDLRVFGNVWHRDARYKICTTQGCRTDQTRRHRDALHIYGMGMPRHGDALHIYGTGMPRPDFWPIQLETGALPNVPFPPITLAFICLPTSRKLFKGNKYLQVILLVIIQVLKQHQKNNMQ